MSTGGVGVADLFHLLESNKLGDVEEMKKVFHDHFLSTKDSWLVNGLFDYYLSTNSLRAVEVLAGVREPHDKHLLDRLTEALMRPSSHGQGNSHRVQALTLLGHVARRHPTWLYKIASHPLFKELLKLLKADGEMLALMSALLLLVMLLPMLPAYLGPILHEIFEVFGRLASYYHHQTSSLYSSSSSTSSSLSCPVSTDKEKLYLLHLKVGLYSLFHRLYAMYPCNFVSYLRQQYGQREQLATFTHTVRPMLDSVRMHPLLVTASKEAETSAARWKKMEHHDVVAECGRFALERPREDVQNHVGHHPRFMPILDSSSSYGPMSGSGLSIVGLNNGDEETFWSPSMVMAPSSPASLQPTPHEPRSTPSTPNNRIGTSPPEAAVEATPETTPVKDLRQLSMRQAPVGSAAVRALGSFGNGTSGGDSRPPTPTHFLSISGTGSGGGDNLNSHVILSQKISKVFAERQTILHHSQASIVTEPDQNKTDGRRERDSEAETDPSQNGRSDSWQEDQEVLEIVSSQGSGGGGAEGASDLEANEDECPQGVLADFSRRLRFHSQCQATVPRPLAYPPHKVRRATSCPEMKMKKGPEVDEEYRGAEDAKRRTEEVGTQTHAWVPYEHLLLGIVTQVTQGLEHQQTSGSTTDSRLSPNSMLDRYIQACSRITTYSNNNPRPRVGHGKLKQKRKGVEEDAGDELGDEEGMDLDVEGGNQQLQLMQMQLQFERQRREVHAERNRRLLGKLRDSRALEEHNSALRDRLRMTESEVECLKSELERSKREARLAEQRHTEALLYWQSQCAEEQRQCRLLRGQAESLQLEVDNERGTVAQKLRETRSAEATLFDAAHQLKGALRAANRGELLKCTLDTLQKRFLLLGEAQLKLQERTGGPAPMARQEAAQIQRAYAEELLGLRRQLDSRASVVEALRARLAELELGEIRREAQLAEQQRLLQQAKGRHEAELEALESKYKAQKAINLSLEERILELLGTADAAIVNSNSNTLNAASSASPKERSPPLSASLASSSEGSMAFIHSGTGIMMNDCCDPAGEITNLQAIVDPGPSPLHTSQQPPK